MHKEIRTKINQAAHLLAQREFARIRLELVTVCEQFRKAGKSHHEIVQAIDGTTGKDFEEAHQTFGMGAYARERPRKYPTAENS